MPIANYAQNPSKEFWSGHWGNIDFQELLKSAKISPLTNILIANLPKQGRIIEAGCGLGQYVQHLRQQGYDIQGCDYSAEAVKKCKEFEPNCPVEVMDVRKLNFPNCYFKAYISLGVVEHFKEGPDDILKEAHRVLSDDGVLLLSVPFTNLYRKICYPFILFKNRLLISKGKEFYQYYYSKHEMNDFLRRNGFIGIRFYPYDAGRFFRKSYRRLKGNCSNSKKPLSSLKVSKDVNVRKSTSVKMLLKKILYSKLSLNIFSHMILVVARKDI